MGTFCCAVVLSGSLPFHVPFSHHQEHNRYLYLRSTEKWKPPTFSVVDVLNYFCSVQKEAHDKIIRVVPGCKNTVLLPLADRYVNVNIM